MEREIEIVTIEKLKPFPGNPKDISEEEALKLKLQLKKHGVLKALSVWKKGKTYTVLDGNQRLTVLKELYAEPGGGDFGHIPVEPVEVKDEQDAADKCLVLVGQYGRVNKAKLKKFVSKAGYKDLDEAQTTFSFPEMDGEDLADGSGEEETQEETNPNTEPWEKVAHVECPSCKVQFPQKKHRCKPEKDKLWVESE